MTPSPAQALAALDELDALAAPWANAVKLNLASLRSFIEAHQWRPIEEAPKDGTEILAWREDCGPFMAMWTCVNDLRTTSDKDRDELDEETLFSEDWFGGDAEGNFRADGSEVPTHFQFLPPAPEEKTGQPDSVHLTVPTDPGRTMDALNSVVRWLDENCVRLAWTIDSATYEITEAQALRLARDVGAVLAAASPKQTDGGEEGNG